MSEQEASTARTKSVDKKADVELVTAQDAYAGYETSNFFDNSKPLSQGNQDRKGEEKVADHSAIGAHNSGANTNLAVQKDLDTTKPAQHINNPFYYESQASTISIKKSEERTDNDNELLAGETAGESKPSTCVSMLTGWNKLALELATGAKRGPTISSRFYALVNSSLYDSWAIFDEDAKCQFNSNDKQQSRSELGQILEGGHKKGNQEGHREKDDLVDAVRQVTMAIAAHDVWQSIGATLFGGSIPSGPFAITTGLNGTSTKGNYDTIKAEAEALLNGALLELANALPPGSKLYADLYQYALNQAHHVSNAVIAWAENDGANQANKYADTTSYKPKPSVFDPNLPNPIIDSNWQPLTINGKVQTALTPQWGKVLPFAIGSGQAMTPQTVVMPYNSDGSLNQTFVDQTKEVLAISMHLTPEMKAIAEYWEAGAGSSFPPGKWMEFTNELIQNRGLALEQAMKLSFSVSQALLDAGIAAWTTKYKFDTIRPITAINELFYGQNMVDGTPLTDWRGVQLYGQDWMPYQNPGSPTPNFPDTFSGHSCFSTAAASVLREFLGSNSFGKSITLLDSASRFDANGFDGVSGEGAPITLTWDYLSSAAEQAGMSRLYGGIHASDGNWLGQIGGAQVANMVLAKAESLFGGEDNNGQASQQTFGTMHSDILTGLEIEISQSSQEIYGFGGDDTLICSRSSGRQSLFGGDGTDTFKIIGRSNVYIRDLQAGETILIDSSLFGSTPDTTKFQLASSSLGSNYTDLLYSDNLIAHIDGNFAGSNQINFGFMS